MLSCVMSGLARHNWTRIIPLPRLMLPPGEHNRVYILRIVDDSESIKESGSPPESDNFLGHSSEFVRSFLTHLHETERPTDITSLLEAIIVVTDDLVGAMSCQITERECVCEYDTYVMAIMVSLSR